MTRMNYHTDFLILGGGLAGLTAGMVLGDRAMVLERESRPGGLVRTECFDGYWFDRVIHLLYFPDEATARRIRPLIEDCLAPCPPEAFVETSAGVARYPVQMNLAGLAPEVTVGCLNDLAQVTFDPPASPASSYEDMLRRTFGRGLCELFFLPYNRKMWKRPLASLTPDGFTWNLTRPDFRQVLAGSLSARPFAAYNANGFYPRPPRGARVRGMELLSHRLALRQRALRLEHSVESLDLERRVVWVRHRGGSYAIRYQSGCANTLPLPRLLEMCPQTPPALLEATRRLTCNRVVSVALRMRGPRPEGRGLWRYYADESLVFSRLVYMHAFDPLSAPDDGWGLLAEVTERSEDPRSDPQALIARVVADAQRAGAWPDGNEVLGGHVMYTDPAYVVFTRENQAILAEALEFLRRYDVEPLGRYGRWEYSSMGQVMRDALAWADGVADRPARGERPVVHADEAMAVYAR